MSTASEIVKNLGGPQNIQHLTHCATRLRFQLGDASVVNGEAVEGLPEVMGVVPQSGNRYQIIIGGAVATVFEEIQALPEMKNAGQPSDADVKAAARAKGPRGKFSWLDNFFEFLSDSFRPIIGALLGASLFITFMSLMSTIGVIGNWSDPRVTLEPSWQFVNLAWRCVLVFLPLMVAYNGAKKLKADPWVGFAIMAVVMLPQYTGLGEYAHQITVAGSSVDIVNIFGLPLTVFDYSSQVFPPLLMAAVLGPFYKLLKKIIPTNVQLIFVPFFAMLVMIPLTAFILGPIGVYVGAFLGKILLSINTFSPLIFAILIPLAYPFMVPLGLHWPLNAVMLANIQSIGYDFIQGPMGAWNFACFGATAGVLFLAVKNREAAMKQTAGGALVAGLLGGISEPSLYGIHLRYKKIYSRMIPGCLLGGVIIGLGGGLKTNAFIFTSILTIPAFDNIPLYAVAVICSFLTSMLLVIFFGYRDKQAEEPGAVAATAGDTPLADKSPASVEKAASATAVASKKVASKTEESSVPKTEEAAEETPSRPEFVQLTAPVAAEIIPLTEVPDPVFSSGMVGQGVGMDPIGDTVCAPSAGTVMVAAKTGHAVGLKLDNGLEVLIHIGIDTVKMKGEGFDVKVAKGDRVEPGQPLVSFDRTKIEAAGYSAITPLLVTNHKKMASVRQVFSGPAKLGDVVVVAEKKPVKK